MNLHNTYLNKHLYLEGKVTEVKLISIVPPDPKGINERRIYMDTMTGELSSILVANMNIT